MAGGDQCILDYRLDPWLRQFDGIIFHRILRRCKNVICNEIPLGDPL